MTWNDVPGKKTLSNLKDSDGGTLQLGKGTTNTGVAVRDAQVIVVGSRVEGRAGFVATTHQGQTTFLRKVIQKAVDLHPRISTFLDRYVQEHAKTHSATTGL